MNTLTRRHFLRNSAISATALAVAPILGAATRNPFARIVVPRESAAPLATAAVELVASTGAKVVHLPHSESLKAGDIRLCLGCDLGAYPEVAREVSDSLRDKEWELIRASGDALIISGSSPRNVCRAALGWIENPTGETNRFSVYEIGERFTMWDNSMNQMYRFSKGFDRCRHIREIARLGHTGIEINRYADAGGYHVRHRKFRLDFYPWYLSYAPALDAFVESSLTKGIYRQSELAANLDDLREALDLARRYGLKPGFVCYEPRCVAEEIFDRYPELRGSRTDHPGRSLQPRYALDIANPRVLDHYAELVTNLMRTVPDLRYFVFWTQDSGSGMPFANKLYPGPNGSYLARSKTVEEMTADFTRTLLEAGRKINPEFEVIMEIGHEYTADERLKITASLPKGVTFSHPLGGSLLKGGPAGAIESYAVQDRAKNIEPYASLVVSAGFDAEPIIGVPAPGLLAQKFPHLQRLKLQRVFTSGGVWSPPQCAFNINQELYAELIRSGAGNLDTFLFETARRWCDGEAEPARQLVKAWKTGDDAINAWHKLGWYHAGPGQTQARWLIRPLVPNITLLTARERAAWERVLFTLPWDIGRVNIVFEGGIRMFDEKDLEKAVQAYDTAMIPLLLQAVEGLDRTFAATRKRVLEDQRDRYRGLLLRSRSDRNLFEAQLAINTYLMKQGDPAALKERLRKAIEAEIANTRDWIRALKESRTNFFHLASSEETTFLHKTPIEDMKLKLEAMQAHLQDEPGPFLKELKDPKRKLLFSAVA